VIAQPCSDGDRVRGQALLHAVDHARRAVAAVAAAAHGEPNTARSAALATAHATLVAVQGDLEKLQR
jgi:hypothetical protein